MAFEKDLGVLYISLHRHDDANFFPGTGAITEVGQGPGAGYSVNIAWSDAVMGDPEYLAAWRTVVMPILTKFDPEFILVSSGFDGAAGHPSNLGGYLLTPALFGHFTTDLMTLANGKVVLALEGGYDLATICDCAEQCMRALVRKNPAELPPESLKSRPNSNAVLTLHRVLKVLRPHWPDLKAELIDMPHSKLANVSSASEQASVINRAHKNPAPTPRRAPMMSSDTEIDVINVNPPDPMER